MASRFLKHRFRELHPYDVQAVLLKACNLKCVYCRCPQIKTEVLTTEGWCSIIRGLAELGTMRIKFQGGEPTLRSDFQLLCREARQAGIAASVVTNGYRVAVEPEILDDLDEVLVSLDSVEPGPHDRHRGIGSHAVAVRAIDAALERGLPTYVVMAVSRQNLDQLEPMLRFCEIRGILMHAQPLVFGRDSFDDGARDLALPSGDLRAMHERLAEWRRQKRPLMFSAETYQHVSAWPDHNILTTRSDGESSCMAGRFYVNIDANGDVLPCNQHGASFTPMNIIRDGLKPALRHAQHHDCGSCYFVFLNERKAVFGLRPSAVMDVLRRG